MTGTQGVDLVAEPLPEVREPADSASGEASSEASDEADGASDEAGRSAMAAFAGMTQASGTSGADCTEGVAR